MLSDEQAIAAWVMEHGRTMGLYDDADLAASTSARFMQRVIVHSTAPDARCSAPCA